MKEILLNIRDGFAGSTPLDLLNLALGVPFQVVFHRRLPKNPTEESGFDLAPRLTAELAERAFGEEARLFGPGDHLLAGRTGIEQGEQDMRRHIGVRAGAVCGLGQDVIGCDLALIFQPISQRAVAMAGRVRPDPERGLVSADHRHPQMRREPFHLKFGIVRGKSGHACNLGLLHDVNAVELGPTLDITQPNVMDSSRFRRNFLSAAQPVRLATDMASGQVEIAQPDLYDLGGRLGPRRFEVNHADDGHVTISNSSRRSVSMTFRMPAKVARYSRSFSLTFISKFVAAATIAP